MSNSTMGPPEKGSPDDSRSLIPEGGTSILNILENSDDPTGLLLKWVREIPFADRLLKLQTMLGLFPENHYARAVLMYFLAAVVARSEDLETCDRLLQMCAASFLQNSPTIRRHKSGEITLHNMLMHAFYFDPSLDVRAPREDIGEFDTGGIECRKDRRGPVILASANGLYAEQFGKSFMQGIPDEAEVSGVHMHIVNPTERTVQYLGDLAAISRVPLTWTLENQDFGLAYLACARFIVAARVMRHFGRDMVISDLDGAFTTPEALDVRHMLGDAHAGLFEVSQPLEVHHICHCSVSYWRHSPETERFLDLMSSYNIDRLRATDRFWMLDQLSLFVLSRRARRGDFVDIFGPGGFVWKDLTASHGARDRYQRDVEMPLDEKYRLRYRHQRDFGGLKEFAVSFQGGRLVPEGPLRTRV